MRPRASCPLRSKCLLLNLLNPDLKEDTMLAQRWMWIAWPAFLVAGLLEVLVFAFVDPQDLHWFGQDLDLSRQAIYTLAFFAFWALAMVSSALSLLLGMSSEDVNR
jgi:hypothetical protein